MKKTRTFGDISRVASIPNLKFIYEKEQNKTSICKIIYHVSLWYTVNTVYGIRS